MAGKKKSRGTMFQVPLPGLLPETDWRPPAMSELPSSWADAKMVAIDIETCDPDLGNLGPGVRRGAFICGVSFKIDDHPRAYYLPVRHQGGDNLDPEHVMNYLADQAKVFRGQLVGCNLDYEFDFLTQEGVDFLGGPCVAADVATADAVIYELHSSYALDAILGRRGIPLKDERHLRAVAAHYGADPKSNSSVKSVIWRMRGRDAGAYAEYDVVAPLEVYKQQLRELEAPGPDGGPSLWKAWLLEQEVTKALVRLTRRGVRIDEDKLGEIEVWARQQEAEAWAQVKHFTDIDIMVGQGNQKTLLVRALRAIGASPGKTPTGQDQVNDQLLSSIDHPAAKAILRGKKMDKLRGFFCKSMREYMVRGRIHCTYNQTRRSQFDKDANDDSQRGTSSYRLSAVDPNLQQQPARHPEIGPLWRSIFVPEPGEEWVSSDFSSQEPRFGVHFATLLRLEGGPEAAQAYRENPRMDFHEKTSKITGQKRKDAKETFLARMYLMGGARFCERMGLPIAYKEVHGKMIKVAGPEGQKMLDQIDNAAPWANRLGKIAMRKAERVGMVRLVDGHRCHFEKMPDGSYYKAYKAGNKIIQGSAAIQMKLALVAADRAGLPTNLSVHDELCMSARNREQMRNLRDVMEGALQLEAPSVVDLEVGPNWGHCVKINLDGEK